MSASEQERWSAPAMVDRAIAAFEGNVIGHELMMAAALYAAREALADATITVTVSAENWADHLDTRDTP